MFSQIMMGAEIKEDIDRLYKELNSDVKSTRRTALLGLKKRVASRELISPCLLGCFSSLLNIIASDSVESHRETAASILLALVTSLTVESEDFESFIKVTVEHFGQESSEEVRLLLVKIIHSFITNQNLSQQVYLGILDQLTCLIKMTITDKYGEVIKMASAIIIALSETNDHFRLQADYFVEPLLQNLRTQPMKVRIPCVKALEPVIIHSPLTIPNVMPQLERCWSESGPPLKLAMVRTVGKASLELELDDQNFHLLIPTILLGKCNDFSEVVEEAENTWKALENQSGFEQVLGQSFSKILPKLLKDTEDWNTEIRIQASQLIYQFLQGLPDRKREINAVMELVTFQVGDQEASVRNWACRSARLVGENCAQDALVWLSHHFQNTENSQLTNADVMTYTHVVKGFLYAARPLSPATIELCVDLAVKLSSVKDPSLLECVEALLEKKVCIDDKRMNQLLCVALSLEGVKESNFYSRKIAILDRVADHLGYPDISTMIRHQLPILWTTFQELPDEWTPSSLPWNILQFVAGDMKIINSFIFDCIQDTINTTKSPEIKLKSFNLLTTSMERIECDSKKLQTLLLANVKWKAGRSASVLRSSVALCAYTAISHQKLEIIPSNLDTFVEAFLPLVEDEILGTRLAAIQILIKFLLGRPTQLDTILTTLMDRLNDISKDVRHGVTIGLQNFFLECRLQGSSHSMEQKFIQLVRVLSRDDDLPSKTFAEGVLRTMLGGECSAIVNMVKMKIDSDQGQEIESEN